MNNIPVFPVNSAQGFYDQLRASKPDPATGKPDPAAMRLLPAGMEPSDDPLLSARSAAYARSFTLRAGEKEKKAPSAVTTQIARAGNKS
jgi:catalase